MKKCFDLAKGDKIVMPNGTIRTVESVTPGIIIGQKMINYTDGGWSHAYPNEEISTV